MSNDTIDLFVIGGGINGAGVARDAKGNATVYVVSADNKAVQKTIKADRTQGAYWVVTSGLNPGDRIITQDKRPDVAPGGAVVE